MSLKSFCGVNFHLSYSYEEMIMNKTPCSDFIVLVLYGLSKSSYLTLNKV